MFKFTTEQRRKIKKIKYLKNASLTQKKIVLEFDDISRMFRRKKVILGDFKIEILFGDHNRHQIKVTNKKPVIVESIYGGRNFLHHPHVYGSDKHPCLGFARDMVIKQSFITENYIQVILQLFQFLKTYTGHDCYDKLDYWANAKTNEKGERIYNGEN